MDEESEGGFLGFVEWNMKKDMGFVYVGVILWI